MAPIYTGWPPDRGDRLRLVHRRRLAQLRFCAPPGWREDEVTRVAGLVVDCHANGRDHGIAAVRGDGAEHVRSILAAIIAIESQRGEDRVEFDLLVCGDVVALLGDGHTPVARFVESKD